MIFPDQQIIPIHFPELKAFRKAREDYKKFEMSFEEDFADYLENGFVVVRPNLFAMAKMIEFQGERSWFVRYACGDVISLVGLLPFYLKWIVWCRRNEPFLRRYRTERLWEIAKAKSKKERKG